MEESVHKEGQFFEERSELFAALTQIADTLFTDAWLRQQVLIVHRYSLIVVIDFELTCSAQGLPLRDKVCEAFDVIGAILGRAWVIWEDTVDGVLL